MRKPLHLLCGIRRGRVLHWRKCIATVVISGRANLTSSHPHIIVCVKREWLLSFKLATGVYKIQVVICFCHCLSPPCCNAMTRKKHIVCLRLSESYFRLTHWGSRVNIRLVSAVHTNLATFRFCFVFVSVCCRGNQFSPANQRGHDRSNLF